MNILVGYIILLVYFKRKKKKMNDPIEIIINQNNQFLRISCGQCGDTKDIIFEIIDKKIHVFIDSSRDIELEPEGSECFSTPIHVVI